jgi:hypothetical protein
MMEPSREERRSWGAESGVEDEEPVATPERAKEVREEEGEEEEEGEGDRRFGESDERSERVDEDGAAGTPSS